MTLPRQIDRRALLGRISIFEGLSKRELDLLHAITGTKRVRERETLFYKGDEGSTLYGVLRGRLRGYAIGGDAKEYVFNFMGPGEVIGEVALLDAQPRSLTIEAVEPSELLTLHRRDLLPFVEQNPKVALKLASVLARRLRALSESQEDAMLLSIPGRLAKKLLALSQGYGKAVAGGGTRIELKLPQGQLGELIGATRESVNKQMRVWVETKVIRVERGYITILSEEALEDTAGFAIS